MTDTESTAARHRDAETGVEMIAFAERLRTSTRAVPVKRVRLQRVVVTERRTIEVDVRHEEVRIVEDDLAPGDGTTGAERATPWVVLRREHVEVVRSVEETERVRLVLDAVEQETTLVADVRHEVIDAEQRVPSASR